MNLKLLEKDIQDFIKKCEADTAELAFKGSPFPEISTIELIEQIEGYRKTKSKLPTWYQSDGIIFPKKISIEQTSSETTAAYKSKLLSGNTLADITGGFGVDAYYFSKSFHKVDYFEQNTELATIARHNFKQLKISTINTCAEEGIEGIKNKKYDVIYADPARRHNSKGKVFFLEDCEPNILEHLDYLLKRTSLLVIKTSPMLDISIGIQTLKKVLEVHIIAVENEVKELLWILKKEVTSPIKILTCNFTKDKEDHFQFLQVKTEATSYSNPLTYLYEPNGAILKSGGFNEIGNAFQLLKIAPFSHLYTHTELIEFPGRVFKITAVIPYKKKELKKIVNTKANITTRNFPVSVAQLRNKLKIEDGGNTYLFFTTLALGEKVVIISEK